MTTFTEDISTANILVNKNKFEEAISHFEIALEKSEFDEQQIDISNSIGRLYFNLNEFEKAAEAFEKSLSVHKNLSEEKAITLQVNKATILNNLGAIFLKQEVKKAIKSHKEALEIFIRSHKNEPEVYSLHLGNTHYSLAEAFYVKKDFFMAKKHFKEGVKIYESIKENPKTSAVLKANAFYNLGNIYTDENNVHDARTNYLKALKLFSVLTDENPKAYRAMVAATLNNLGVTAKSMYIYSDAIKYYEKTLEHYEILIAENRNNFLPFYAATLNSLGIIHTEQHEVKDDYDSGGLSGFSGFGMLSVDNMVDEEKMLLGRRQKEKAVEYYKKAAEVYNELSEKEPEVFTHYLATVLHNLGVLHDDKKDFDKASAYYEQALKIRKFLADKQPEAFNLDVCVTLLNMVTMFQNLIELQVDITYKSKALEFLKEIETRISNYSDELPVVLSMKSDTQYFTQYFNQVDGEYLEVLAVMGKADIFSEEIKSTIVPTKKLKFQKQVLNLLYGLYTKYPENERLKAELLNTYIEYSWLALRSNEIALAEKAIENGFKIDENSLSLKANQAHLFLIKNEVQKAKEIYNSLKDIKNEGNESFKKVLEADLTVLKKDGVYLSENDSDLFNF